MATLEPIVVANGFLIATILHRQACALSDEEGFFLGEEEKSITDRISDSHIGGKDEYLFLNIYDFVPIPSLFHFYDCFGNIKTEVLSELLGDKVTRIIGWYKIRRNTSFEVSVREKHIHKNLLALRPNDSKNFFFGLFTSSASQSSSTISTQHLFLKQKEGKFVPMKWKTANLHSADTSQYKHYDGAALSRGSLLFQQVMMKVADSIKLQGDNKACVGMAMIENFQSNLKNLQQQLTQKEEESSQLDEEIKILQQSISARTNDKTAKQPIKSEKQLEKEPNQELDSSKMEDVPIENSDSGKLVLDADSDIEPMDDD